MNNRTRNVVLVTVIVVALSLIVWMSWSASNSTSDLSALLRRRSPLTDYITAESEHNDCVASHQVAFFAHVATAFTADPADRAARATARQQLTEDGNALAHLEQLCPTPAAPIFDDNGNVVGHTTTTATTIPPPGG